MPPQESTANINNSGVEASEGAHLSDVDEASREALDVLPKVRTEVCNALTSATTDMQARLLVVKTHAVEGFSQTYKDVKVQAERAKESMAELGRAAQHANTAEGREKLRKLMAASKSIRVASIPPQPPELAEMLAVMEADCHAHNAAVAQAKNSPRFESAGGSPENRTGTSLEELSAAFQQWKECQRVVTDVVDTFPDNTEAVKESEHLIALLERTADACETLDAKLEEDEDADTGTLVDCVRDCQRSVEDLSGLAEQLGALYDGLEARLDLYI